MGRTPPPEGLQRSCIACEGGAVSPSVRGLVRCDACGMVFYPPVLTDAEEKSLYGDAYFTGAEYQNYLHDRPVHEANFRRRIQRLKQWIPEGSSVLEIGCCYGLFLHLAASLWKVSGWDVAEASCAWARRVLSVDARAGDFASAAVEQGSADAVCMWDTIEHVNHLEDTLTQVSRVLRPGGIFALTTGDIGSLLARSRGARWRQIHPPSHLWYFSAATLAHTLDRFGFDVVRSDHIGISRSVGQILHGVFGESILCRLADATGIARLRVYANTGDLQFVIARRRDGSDQSAV